jgi:hypothetical protein
MRIKLLLPAVLFSLASTTTLSCQKSNKTKPTGQQHSNSAGSVSGERNISNAMTIDLKPGRSIGALRLGMSQFELPKEAQASVADEVGCFDGIHFLLNKGVVEDVWIDQLRTFPYDIQFEDGPVSRSASVSEIKALFGPCARVKRITGGIFYNCKKGITLGLDIEESEKYVQIRLKPR